jgi:transcriptional antiterminator RfaH
MGLPTRPRFWLAAEVIDCRQAGRLLAGISPRSSSLASRQASQSPKASEHKSDLARNAFCFAAGKRWPKLPRMSRSETENSPSPTAEAEPQPAWFCVRTHVKHEHVAAQHLRKSEHLEVFNPRIRFIRPTRVGTICVVESLFPSYIFARFDWRKDFARVNYAPAVAEVVHFGARWPAIPDSVIAELRAIIGPQELRVLKEPAPGDTVQIAGGILHGLKAVVTHVMPGRQRVMVLMDFLGRQTSVELPANQVAKTEIRL